MLNGQSGYSTALLRDLDLWRERAAALSAQMVNIQRERDDLLKKILAAEVLLGQTGDAPTNNSASLRAAIKDLMADGRVRTPKEMRRDLIHGGIDPKRVSSAAGSFYTALLRLVEDTVLKKDDVGRYWDPAKSTGPASLEDMLK